MLLCAMWKSTALHTFFFFCFRDFVSVRQIAVKDGCYYSASQATITSLKPEQPGKVRYCTATPLVLCSKCTYLHYNNIIIRAENGPCGYVVIPIDSGRTKLIWIINTNLKVMTTLLCTWMCMYLCLLLTRFLLLTLTWEHICTGIPLWDIYSRWSLSVQISPVNVFLNSKEVYS